MNAVRKNVNTRPYNKRLWLLGKVHAVANRLGMPDPQRRDFMLSLVGENSCRDMSERQLVQVLLDDLAEAEASAKTRTK